MKFVKPGWLAIPETLRNLATPDTMKTIGIATLPIAKAISPMMLLHVVAARWRYSPSQSHEPREPHGNSLSGFNGECCDRPGSGVGEDYRYLSSRSNYSPTGCRHLPHNGGAPRGLALPLLRADLRWAGRSQNRDRPRLCENLASSG